MDLISTKSKDSMKLIKRILLIILSALVPFLIVLTHPLGFNMNQSLVVGILLLVIIWWCTGLVNKITASCVLLLNFLLFSGAQIKTIFSFPMSSTFLLITLTYLFSKGVLNSRMAERYLEPLLIRCAGTPMRAILTSGAILVITMYAIPQPLARIIIVADIMQMYLNKIDVDEKVKNVILFGVFVMYIYVNMLTMNADIILNTTAVAVSGIEMTDGRWMLYMSVPSLLLMTAALALIRLVFAKDIAGKHLCVLAPVQQTAKVNRRDKMLLAVLAVTICLWFTESLHGIPAWVVTLFSIVIMFLLGTLHPADLKAIDIPMLVFLTAAMSIGGVMSANGTADIIFSALRELMSGSSTLLTVLAVMAITMCMHMVLGSNTTTLSVVIPGIIYMCRDMLPAEIIMFIVYITSVSQWLFPFHSVGLMMGSSKNYFPSAYVTRLGLPMTVLVFLAVFLLFIPWWRLIGLM
ncbi:hypothetical protein SDC9_41769 [bioreactor metagenome]|uniref:Sodium-dependent dicarboxylate transporter SdcS n=1 Tax=bioreactor metagenome TaxID=1076179 RepID=A0A644VWF5_9ZZZZ